jgi:ribosomal-protein-serine acetyltransferase
MFLLQVDKDLALAACVPTYAVELFALIEANREHLREWLPWLDETTRLQQVEQFLRDSRRNADNGAGQTLLLLERRRIVGVLGQHYIDRVDKKTELGYWLDAACQGRGLMTRAMTRLLEHIFTDLELNRVVLHCGVENIRSRAIPERLGFSLEGILRQSQWLYDHYVDLAVYGLLERDWRRLRRPVGNLPSSRQA